MKIFHKIQWYFYLWERIFHQNWMWVKRNRKVILKHELISNASLRGFWRLTIHMKIANFTNSKYPIFTRVPQWLIVACGCCDFATERRNLTMKSFRSLAGLDLRLLKVQAHYVCYHLYLGMCTATLYCGCID